MNNYTSKQLNELAYTSSLLGKKLHQRFYTYLKEKWVTELGNDTLAEMPNEDWVHHKIGEISIELVELHQNHKATEWSDLQKRKEVKDYLLAMSKKSYAKKVESLIKFSKENF